MRFVFNPGGERAGGVRLIHEIPDYRICHLEGRNGAGKSLALRLLELISGQQPYLTIPGAWTSLRENLGNTTVTISGLANKTLRVDLKPEHWAKSPEPVAEWLGDAFLDEKPLPITSVGALLRVERISGDETFERTIGRRLDSEAASIKRAHDRFVEQFSQLERDLAELADATSVVDPERRAQQRLEELKRALERTERELRSNQEKIDRLNEALLARQRLSAFVDESPDIDKRLRELRCESEEAGKNLRSAQERQTALLAALARGSEVETQMEMARQARDAQSIRLQKIDRKVQHAAAQLNVSPDIKAIAGEIATTKDHLGQIHATLASTGHNASVREFIDRTSRDLNIHRELDTEIVALIPTDSERQRLTGSDLREGLQQRLIELVEIEDDPLRRELSQRKVKLTTRISQLNSLAKLLRDHDKESKHLREKREDLAALVGRAEATGELRTEYDDLAAEILALENAVRLRLAEEARLRVHADQLSAGKSQEELAENLKIALDSLQIRESSSLDPLLQAAKASAEEQRDRRRQIQKEQMDVQRSLALEAAEIERVSAKLAALPWLPASVREALAKDTSLQSGQAILALRDAVEFVRESLYIARNRFDQLLAAARNLADEVGKRERTQSEVKLLPQLAAEMGERLRKEFDQEEIRNALFDGGQLRSIDLRALEAQWITRDGELRNRPFEAFSSGEQAFAYIRARIQSVASIEAKHRVIALDEFGAFLARDRLERLARYLREAIIGSIAEQVVIVVPLSANYETQAKVTSGELGERFARRAAEIESHRYFAEDATQRELV